MYVNYELFHFQVFINPKLKIIDYSKVVHVEGCESIRSFAAEVARYNEVQVTGIVFINIFSY